MSQQKLQGLWNGGGGKGDAERGFSYFSPIVSPPHLKWGRDSPRPRNPSQRPTLELENTYLRVT